MATILFVEHDEAQRKHYSSLMERAGYGVVQAKSAEEAIKCLDRLKECRGIDAVVTAVELPGMNGLDLIPKVLAADVTMPVIIHTAYPNYQDNFLSWTANAYVIKQQGGEELLEEIGKAIDRRSKDRKISLPLAIK